MRRNTMRRKTMRRKTMRRKAMRRKTMRRRNNKLGGADYPRGGKKHPRVLAIEELDNADNDIGGLEHSIHQTRLRAQDAAKLKRELREKMEWGNTHLQAAERREELAGKNAGVVATRIKVRNPMSEFMSEIKDTSQEAARREEVGFGGKNRGNQGVVTRAMAKAAKAKGKSAATSSPASDRDDKSEDPQEYIHSIYTE